MGPWPTGALCLSTPKHNGKSGTGYRVVIRSENDNMIKRNITKTKLKIYC